MNPIAARTPARFVMHDAMVIKKIGFSCFKTDYTAKKMGLFPAKACDVHE
ncbi:hypothetical protein JCM17846_05190 [Iodidimonas nitroreducens]|uniref:Uncharacterized protein n=1 Tax=Iodidimonas nitroreducens TaxID=1236968 RepID=A0A5A7N4B0_9PROT|nr:hypothetical protein JCM17846_05190 [Iodidimonas nitroreducens]